MTLSELKQEIQKYQYIEDTDIIDMTIAATIANRVTNDDPVWFIIIGPSSGGKSQILRPLALTDPKFIHRVDDLTENTLLSGMQLGAGKDASLLSRIGPKGILVISDLTVLFSKNKESRAAILSQLRMIYDGEMTKYIGNKEKPVTWKGSLGIIAGSTPSIYSHFEEVADMGERFIYYRMKDYDPEKATRIAMSRRLSGKKLDAELSDLYGSFIKEVVLSNKEDVVLNKETEDVIINIAMLAEKIRTTSHVDFRTKDMDKLPVAAMPMRVSIELTKIAKALLMMRQYDTPEYVLGPSDWKMLEWSGYSLANEEKRACLRVLASLEYLVFASTQIIADNIGLSTNVIGSILQNMAAIGVLTRTAGNNGLTWRITHKRDWETIRRIEGIVDSIIVVDRKVVEEEDDMMMSVNAKFDSI